MKNFKPIKMSPEMTAKRIAIKKKRKADILLALSHTITTEWITYEGLHRGVNEQMQEIIQDPKFDIEFIALNEALTRFEMTVARLEWKSERHGIYPTQKTSFVRLKSEVQS